MDTTQPDSWVPLGIVALLAIAFFVVGIIRVRNARRRAARRVVEQPNSHYVAPLVRENETRHRWQNMPLDGIHEVNRGEIQRLLAKVEAIGVEALRPNERSFLDYMAGLRA